MARYIYQPLPPIPPQGVGPPYTRLLSLTAGTHKEPLHCTLANIQTDNSPPYEALSYVWGKKTAEIVPPILCDGQPISITPNLDNALRYLRYEHQPRSLWVDAICIDQENTQERSRQVQDMRLVYKHASRVVVWLGPKAPGIELAFDLAAKLARVRDIPQTGLVSFDVLVGMSEDDFELATFYLSDIFDREYFVRTWCVQEVVAATACIGKSEDLEINFLDLLSSSQYVVARRGQMFPGKPLEFWNMISLKKSSPLPSDIEGSMGGLLILLGATRDFKATDARDKVFALFGISDEGLQPHLALTKIMGNRDSFHYKLMQKTVKGIADFVNSSDPEKQAGRPKALKTDYDKDLMEVYRDLARFLIRCSPRVLDVLSHVQHTDDPTQSFYFPSWVPKWFQPRSASILGGAGMFLAGFCDGHFRYFATVHDNPLSGNAVQPNHLRLDGFKVDRVTKVSSVMTFGLHDPWPAEAIWVEMFGSPLFPRPALPIAYRNGEALDIAFCLTAMASPLGGVFEDLLATQSGHGKLSDKDLPRLKQRAKADVAQFLIENSGVETSSTPQYGALLALMQSAGEYASTERFNLAAKIFSHNRCFYVTQTGFLGIGPQMMKAGDEMCIFYGGRTPYILRPMYDHHVFIGDTYVYDEDIMWGKATESVMRGRSHIPAFTFELR
ncbi:HET domain-containing protein [Tricladium varicosporioides]|nr:HET domain-containing protein [Hymenoscyphus varicosporioides]